MCLGVLKPPTTSRPPSLGVARGEPTIIWRERQAPVVVAERRQSFDYSQRPCIPLFPGLDIPKANGGLVYVMLVIANRKQVTPGGEGEPADFDSPSVRHQHRR